MNLASKLHQDRKAMPSKNLCVASTGFEFRPQNMRISLKSSTQKSFSDHCLVKMPFPAPSLGPHTLDQIPNNANNKEHKILKERVLTISRDTHQLSEVNEN